MHQLEELWMVVRRDIHGTYYSIRNGDRLTSEEAGNKFMQAITGLHRKPHGQDYFAFSYTSGSRKLLIEKLDLQLT